MSRPKLPLPAEVDDIDRKRRQNLGEKLAEIELEEVKLVTKRKELDKLWRRWRRVVEAKYRLKPDDEVQDDGKIVRK